MSKVESVIAISAAVGVLAIAAYFVYQATSAPTNQTGSSCSGSWTDYINPACWLTGAQAQVSNDINAGTNEINTILIIVGVVVLIVVGVLAFSPNGASLASVARSFV